MHSNRKGISQKLKVAEQYTTYQGNPGLAIMLKSGWVPGLGLGDGKGRLGEPSGLKGSWQITSATTVRRSFMVPIIVPMFVPVPGGPVPPLGQILVLQQIEVEEPHMSYVEATCGEFWGGAFPVEPAARCARIITDCERGLGKPCCCCVCAFVPGGATRLTYLPHR